MVSLALIQPVVHFSASVGGALLFALVLVSCGGEPPACRVNNDVVGHQSLPLKGNAGCWLEKDQRLVMIKHRFGGAYAFPGGTREQGETAQCTAHRETWEETGLDVKVGALMHHFDNGFYLFRCSTAVSKSSVRDVWEVSEVFWLDPESLPEGQWRFPEQRAAAVRWLREAPYSRP